MPRKRLPIRRLPSGSWQARPAGVDPATFELYDDAEAWCLDQLGLRSRGESPGPGTSRITTRVYGEEWAAAQTWSHGTRRRVESNLRRRIYPRIGATPITKLRPTQLQAVVTALSVEDGLSPGTVRLVVQHLRQLLNAAQLDGIRRDNPARTLKLPRPDDGPLMVPTAEQVHAIAAAIDPAYRALVAVGAGLGLRQGEAFGLTRDSVDFLRQRVYVRAQVTQGPKGRPVWTPTTKTGKARTVPLPDVVAAELAWHLEHHDPLHPDGLLFASRTGLLLRSGWWDRDIWRRAADAAGLDAGFHSLRHFCATRLLREGVGVAAVARMLGHSPATCLRTYAHYVADDDGLIRSTMDTVLTIGNEDNKAAGSDA